MNVVAINTSIFNRAFSRIIRAIYDGKLKPEQLDQELLLETFNELNTGAQEGYGKPYIAYQTQLSTTVLNIQRNLFNFSAYKTYDQLTAINDGLVDENGKLRSFNDFKKEADKLNVQYNKNYLQAEFQTAKASAQMIRKWNEFQEQKELYPNLIYKTVGDNHVRDEHAKLNGLIKPLDDPFWNTHYPPNGFRCRCTVTSTDKPADNSTIKIKVDKGFEQNVGKTQQAFSETKHPFFSQPKNNTKQLKDSVEASKLYSPNHKQYVSKNKGSVSISPFVAKDEVYKNYRSAIKLANNKHQVILRPDIDTNILKGYKNSDYIIDGRFAELKAIENFNNLGRILSDAKSQCMNKKINPKQTEHIVVFDLVNFKGDKNFKELETQLKRSIHTDRGRSIESIIVLDGKKYARLTRVDIINRDFSKLHKIQ